MMKNNAIFIFFLCSSQLFGLGMTFYEPILKQFKSDLDTKKIKSIDDLSPELRKQFSDFIKNKLRSKEEYIPLSQQLAPLLPQQHPSTTIANLETIAIDEGYGYKYANLRILETLCQQQSTTQFTLAIPQFEGIPSQNIQQFLKNNNLDITQAWKDIINKYCNTAQIQNNTLNQKRYPDYFLDACESLESNIKNTFNQFINTIPSDISFNDIFKAQNIDQLINNIAQDNEKLMVRSTGKEDTATLANAGGNESISNVSPTAKNILKAIGAVIASYFGKKSLVQRLGAGDESLFDPVPFTPILLQRMIGEKDKQIPKCGVMFTEEAEGGIARQNIKTDDGKIQTTGITLIQAAYGHNEGVVNSLIPVDSFYIDNKTNIYPVIRQKTYRMSPADEGKLELQKNTDTFAHEPSLSTDELQTLKNFAKLLEQTYDGPMDVEFVIDEQTKTIYIVQARPIVHDQSLPEPSYIINPETIPQEQKLIGSAIGVAGGALRYCANKNKYIVAETIGKALDAYQNHTADKNQIECIIVGAMAPSTSHEATAFRSEKKPVLYIEDIDTAMQWHKDNEKLIISPQQGLVINQDNETSVEQLIQDNFATNGWIEYPIPRFISCSSAFKPASKGLTIDIIKTFLPKNFTEKQLKIYFAKPWKELIQLLKTGTTEEASFALATLLTNIHGSIIKTAKETHGDQDLLDKIMLLQNYALQCATHIKNNLSYSQTDPEYMQRLLPIRFLESLLYQQPKPTDIIDGYSLATIVAKEMIPEAKITEKLTEQKIAVTPLTVQLMKIKEYALVPELEKSWETFIKQLAQIDSKVLKQGFVNFITDLGKLELIPTWINTSFAEKIKITQDTKQIATDLIREFTSQTTFITQLFEKKEIVDALSIDSFSDPKNFATQWNSFEQNILNYFLSNEFTNSYKNANNLAKLAALAVMTQLIDTFDLSIKAVTGSTNPNYNANKKVTNFHTMLKQYAQLFKTWITLVPEGAITYNPQTSLKKYIEIIDNILNKKTTLGNNLKRTTNFYVSMFTIGAMVSFGHYTQPNTFEDIFMMIHQCLLATLNSLNKQMSSSEIKLMPLLQKISNEIQTANIIGFSGTAYEQPISLTGITFQEKYVTLSYNLPLRDHSMQLQLKQKKNDPVVQLSIKFFGENENQRWDKIICITKILAMNLFNVIITQATVLEDEFICILSININSQSNIAKLLQFIKAMAEYSYKSTDLTRQYLAMLPLNQNICDKNILLKLLIHAGDSRAFSEVFLQMNNALARNDEKQLETASKYIKEINRLYASKLDYKKILETLHNMISAQKETLRDSIQLLFMFLSDKVWEQFQMEQRNDNSQKEQKNEIINQILQNIQRIIDNKQEDLFLSAIEIMRNIIVYTDDIYQEKIFQFCKQISNMTKSKDIKESLYRMLHITKLTKTISIDLKKQFDELGKNIEKELEQ